VPKGEGGSVRFGNAAISSTTLWYLIIIGSTAGIEAVPYAHQDDGPRTVIDQDDAMDTEGKGFRF